MFIDALEDWLTEECREFANGTGNSPWNHKLQERMIEKYTSVTNQMVVKNSLDFICNT